MTNADALGPVPRRRVVILAAVAVADPTRLAAQRIPELEVVRAIGTGQSTRAIASALHRSIQTRERYRRPIGAKLGLNNPTALAQWAWQFVHAARAA